MLRLQEPETETTREKLVDGGIILAKAMDQRQALRQQIILCRQFIRAIFPGTG